MRCLPFKIHLLNVLLFVICGAHVCIQQVRGLVVLNEDALLEAVEETNEQRQEHNRTEGSDLFQFNQYWEYAGGLSKWWWSMNDDEDKHQLHERWSELEKFLKYHKEQAESDMQQFWDYHEARAKEDIESLRKSLEDVGKQFESALQYHKSQMEDDLKSLEESVQAESVRLERILHEKLFYIQTHIIEKTIFGQRHGVAGVYTSIRNFAGALFGASTTFWTKSPTLAKVSISLQSAGLARIFLPKHHDVVRDAASFGVLSFALVMAHRNHYYLQQEAQERDRLNEKSLQHTPQSSSVAATLLYQWLPPATISAAFFDTTLEIINRWQQPGQTQQSQSQESTNQCKVQKQQTINAVLLSVATVVPSLIVTFTLPPRWRLTAAASVAGAKLFLDSVSDEIVGNWMKMIRHMPSQSKRRLGERIGRSVRKRMERRILYPARDALEELEAVVGNITQKTRAAKSYQEVIEILSNMSKTTKSQLDGNSPPPNGVDAVVSEEAANNDDWPKDFGRKVKEAVARSLRLRLRWCIAAAGIMSQLLLPHISYMLSKGRQKLARKS